MSDGTALCGVTVIDGRGGATADQVVVIEDGAIADIVPMGSYARVAGREELDLDGFFVMPGLIDAHVHLAGGRADISDQELGVVAEPTLLRAMRSVYEAQAILKRGFTSVRDVSWNGLYLKRLFREGQIPGPRVVACGPGLTRTGGHADMYQFTSEYSHDHGPWGYVADGPEEIRKAVRTLLREGADAIKVFASGGDNWPHDRNGDVHYSPEEIRMVVEEAKRQRGTVVMCHAENAEAIRMAVDAGVDTIEHGEDLDDDIVAAMADRGTILVPTLELIVNWHRDFMPVDDSESGTVRTHAFLQRDLHVHHDPDFEEVASQQVIASFQKALAGGVRIALGSDTVFEPLTPYGEYSARELTALVRCGMTTPQAITAATATAADALGLGHLIGTVEIGKRADLLVVRTDPTTSPDVLYDPDNIHLTFCDGTLTVVDGHFVR